MLVSECLLPFQYILGSELNHLIIDSDSTGSGVNLSGNEERHECRDDDPVKWDFSTDLEVFMASEGGSREMIDIIFEEGSRQSCIIKDVINDFFDGFIVSDNIKKCRAFGGCIFKMPHIDVKPAAVE